MRCDTYMEDLISLHVKHSVGEASTTKIQQPEKVQLYSSFIKNCSYLRKISCDSLDSFVAGDLEITLRVGPT